MQNKELYLMVNSPGGDGIAAERIVKVCRAYSLNRKFSVIVPKRAKSAATMICLGANGVLMSETSELGPIDPQFPVFNKRGEFTGFQAAHEIIKSYQDLMGRAVQSKGNIDAFLDQLQNYDAREIQRMKSAQGLSESIAIKLLKGGCSNRRSIGKIKEALRPFTNPAYTKDHGRPIYIMQNRPSVD